MKLVLDSIAVLSCLVLIIQDFRYFKVSVGLLLLFGISSAIYWRCFVSAASILSPLLNILLLTSLLGTIFLYIVLTKKDRSSLLQKYFGLGDVLFLMGLIFTCSSSYYLTIIIISSISAILIVIVKSAGKGLLSQKIPFVSYLGIFYLFFKLLDRLDYLPSLYSEWALMF